MCYIFNCFGWTLDLIQRFITFFLACCLCYAICVGLAVALVAGVAYGYNYSLAEFVTFTRSDVTVYMRRGQFYDKPDLKSPWWRAGRRSGENGDFVDSQSQNTGIDYNDIRKQSDDVKSEDKEVLKVALKKSHETSNYADRVGQFEFKAEPQAEMSEEAQQAQVMTETIKTVKHSEPTEPQVYYKLTTESTSFHSLTASPHGSTMLPLLYTKLLHRTTGILEELTSPPNWYDTPKTYKPGKQKYMPSPTLPPRRTPEPPSLENARRTYNPAISTVIYRSGNSPIIMRNFRPINTIENRESTSLEEYTNKSFERLDNMELVEKQEPSFIKNFGTSIPRRQFVKRVKPKTKPPSGDLQEQDQENSEEYEESATRVHTGPKHWRSQGKKNENYPNEEYYPDPGFL